MPQTKWIDDITPTPTQWMDDPPPTSGGFASGYGLPSFGDIFTTAGNAAIGLGEAAVGLGDIVTSPLRMGLDALGLPNRAFSTALQEDFGYDPKMTKAFISSFDSDELKAAKKRMAEAQGVGGTLSTLWDNPGLGALTLEEALPYLAGGAGIGRAAATVLPRAAPWVLGAIGEGVLGAGSQAAQIREDTGDITPGQALGAAGSGALTGLISGGSGKVAGKLGLPDIDAMLADDAIRGVRRIPALFGGAASEGIEEALQSGQEQAAVNLATGRSIGQGVAPAMTMGGLAGGVMGGTVPMFRSPHAPPVGDMSGYTQQELPLDYQPQQESLIPHPIRRFDELSDLGVRNPEQATELDALRQQLGADQRPIPQPPGIDPFTQRFRKIPTGPPVQQGFDLQPQSDEQGQMELFNRGQPPGPPAPPAGPVGGAPITPPGAPIQAPEGSTISADQKVVTISAPNAVNVQFWRDQGYVPVPGGQRSPEGHGQMVRGEDAPLYVTGDKRLPPPPPVPRPEIPGPMPQGLVGGNVVRVPNAQAQNAKFLAGMSENYVVAGQDATHTTFKRKVEGPALATSNEPPQTPEQIQAALSAMLGRPATPEEVQMVLDARQQGQPGAPTPIGAGMPPIDMSQWPPNGPFVAPVNQSQGVQQTPGLEGMGPLPTQPRGNVVPGMQMPPPSGDISALRQQALFGPEPPNPRQMDPRMAARVEAGGPRSFDFTQAPNQQGQMELPWARGENPMPIDGDAAMRQMAADANARRLAAMPQPIQQELDFGEAGPIRNEPSFARSAPPSLQGGVFEAAVAHMQQETDINVLREYMDITTKALQFHRNSGNAAELGLYRQLREAVVHRLNTIAEGNQPAHARVAGGGYKASMNIRRGVENITKDYTSPLPGIMAREGLQNALDAADALGVNGDVKIRMGENDDGDYSIEIYDNGKGMDDATLGGKLFEAFSTGKEGEEGATGGKGIGSASYIYGGQKFKIVTVAVDANDAVDEDGNVVRKADGLTYRIETSGTPEQFIMGQSETFERTPVDPRTPKGTTFEVVLKGEHDIDDARAMVARIVENTRNRPSRVVVDEDGNSKGTPLSEVEPDGVGIVEHRMPDSKDDKMVGDFTTTNRNSEVKVLVPTFDEKIPRDEVEIHFLNNGMYQFSETMHLGEQAEGVPDRVLVDIHPLVDDQNELYPFINTREDIKRDIRDEVMDYIKKNITKPGIEKRKNRVQELYDSMSPVPIPNSTGRKSIIFDPGNRLTPAEMQSLTSNPVIQQLVKTYDKLINDILDASGRAKWKDRLEGVGLVFDPGMHGVHIPNPTTGKSTILINPFIRIGDSAMTPKEAAWRNVGTNLHEVAHIGSESGMGIQWSPQDLADPRLGEFVTAYMNELARHGDVGWKSTGHAMDFAHRLGEVYAKFGVDATFKAAENVHAIYTRGGKSGGYSPEIQKLLLLYTESRGRAATTEDLLSGTGVKSTNRGTQTEGIIPSDSSTNRVGATPTVQGTTGVAGLVNRLISDDAGTYSPGKTWQGIKKATGIGMGGEGKKEREYTFIKEALAVPTNATTMLDLSAPGRQGLSLILTPEFWKAGLKMFQGLNYSSFQQIDADLRNKPMMQRPIDPVTGKEGKSFAEQIGTKIFSPASEGVGPRAEATASRWLEMGVGQGIGSKLWRHTAGYPIRATNRAFITFLNHLNINRTEKLLNLARNQAIRGIDTGRTAMPGILGGVAFQSGKNLGFTQKVTTAEAENMNPYQNLVLAKEIAEFVNAATGHATAKGGFSLENAVSKVGPFLFSPGLLNSRIRMMNPVTYVMASPYVRKQYAKAAISTAAAWFIMSQLVKNAAGPEAEVGDDITSADFGKVRVGDARMDLGGGFLQFAVAYGRAYMGGSTSSSSGEFHRFGSGYQAQTQEDMFERFMVNKLNPMTKFAWDVYSASEYNPFHVGDRTAQLFVPLFIQDLKEIYEEDPSLLPMFGTAALLGGGTQIYSKGESVAKLVPEEKDWLTTGGGMRDLMPWNWSNDEGEESRAFPWSER